MPKFPLVYVIIESTVLWISLIVTIIAIVYVHFRLKINKHVRTILLLEIGFTILLLILSIIGFSLIAIFGLVSEVPCKIFGKTIQLSSGSSSKSWDFAGLCYTLVLAASPVFNASLAVIRFYLANQTNNNKMIRHDHVQLMILATTILFGAMCAYGAISSAIHDLNVSPFVAYCLDRPMDKPPIPALVITLIMIAGILVAVIFDVKMYYLIKDRNKIQPGLQMVAWSVKKAK